MIRQAECIESFLKRAKGDQTVYITDVRRIFDEVGEKAFHVHAHLYEGAVEVLRALSRFSLCLFPSGRQRTSGNLSPNM